ncbi:molybdopterin-binding protein [Corynebacterium sp. NML130628]|uniref:molybdopterin-binding protein n=1 Tax=Corynebacterium sp. NML130628 TaxID=1906333 RepID=UPI0008FAED9C|nr:molybdopterin-binding protein [Corynebacterium sp. NML130628]OIR46367.1 molybdenum cofactor biosynthesis protein [Corynebacterium sp. NML130628]
METTTAPTAVVIVVSDRVFGGERKDKASPAATRLLTEAGFQVAQPVIIPEGDEALRNAMAQAVEGGNSLILTCGGTGLGPRNLTPEVTEEFISTRLHGIETQVLIAGLEHSPRAGLCRGVIGLTSREPGASLIVNTPSSRGGVSDTLGVILALWPSLTEWVR